MQPMNIVLIVLIGVLVIAYPIMSIMKNKKEKQKFQEMTNSFKRGDKVLTASGVYGTIVDLHQDGEKRIITIETGTGNNKGYISVDAYAIYSVLPKEGEELARVEDPAPVEEPVKEEPAAAQEAPAAEETPVEEGKVVSPVDEPAVKEKKSKKSKKKEEK